MWFYHPAGLKENALDAQVLKHLQTVCVVIQAAVVEADDHTKFRGPWEETIAQVGKGEEHCALRFKKAQLILEIRRRYHRRTARRKKLIVCERVHTVIQKTDHLPEELSAPVSVQSGNEQQILAPVVDPSDLIQSVVLSD